jgi:hypothetical protein
MTTYLWSSAAADAAVRRHDRFIERAVGVVAQVQAEYQRNLALQLDQAGTSQWEEIAAAREYQERSQPVWHTRDPDKPRYTWRAAVPVIGIWALVVVLAVCLYICARALVTP